MPLLLQSHGRSSLKPTRMNLAHANRFNDAENRELDIKKIASIVLLRFKSAAADANSSFMPLAIDATEDANYAQSDPALSFVYEKPHLQNPWSSDLPTAATIRGLMVELYCVISINLMLQKNLIATGLLFSPEERGLWAICYGDTVESNKRAVAESR
ncbi:hypothetical protein Nepgr_014443 [Nepenthes gracilis]|uniref:Uncharacterized protein n=1 Tax=Nepenthes gracilis TaxID=150966 RepID=A0AAD3SL42_NEPGR|nr:hypothetical protein Nepgr_014443 [Nepenthes gracilis]